MIQERIERFRDTFNTFMTRNLASLGKFNVDFNEIGVGDVCLILDKVHQGTLPVQAKQRYTLGVVEKKISERSFELRYVRQTEEGKCRMFTCERSLQGLALIVRASKLEKIKDEDIILDPIFPIDKLMEQQNETVNTTMEKPKQNNTAGINNEDQPKGNVSTEALQETNSGLDLKSSLKKQPIIRVAFPRSVPTIKDIRRRRQK